MTTFLITIGLSFFILLASLRKEYGIYLIILLLPTYQIRFRIGFVPITFLECLILLLSVTELFALIKHGRLKAICKELISKRLVASALIFLFLAAVAISVFVSPVTIKAGGIFKAYFVETVLFYFLVLLIIDNEQKLQGVWKSLGLLVFSISVFGIYQFLTLQNLPFSWWAVGIASRRIVSVLNHPNALALLLGPILAMLIMLPKKTKFYWVTIILGVATLYLSFSRAAWLALILTLLALGLFTPYKKKILVSLLLVVLLVLVIPFSREKIFELAKGGDPSYQNRLVLWSAAFDMLKKSPLFGVGLMGFHEAYKNYPLGPDRVIQNYPHNFFLNFWAETGLLGLLAMLGLLIAFFKKVYSLLQTEWKALALVATAGMGMILLHGLVDVSYFKNDLSVLFWLIFALPNLTFLKVG